LTTPNISTGFFVGWNVFHEKVSGDFFNETQAFSGTQLRTINTIPILVTSHFYLKEENEVRPYMGMGIGTYNTLQRTQMGIYSIDNNNWQFGLAPSAGLLIPAGDYILLNLEVKYNLAFKTSDAVNHSYLGINLGLLWED